MDEKVKASWERVLHPETLRTNIITASIFSMAFEMLKSSIVEKIKGFYTNEFDKNGDVVSPEYKKRCFPLIEVLSMHHYSGCKIDTLLTIKTWKSSNILKSVVTL